MTGRDGFEFAATRGPRDRRLQINSGQGTQSREHRAVLSKLEVDGTPWLRTFRTLTMVVVLQFCPAITAGLKRGCRKSVTEAAVNPAAALTPADVSHHTPVTGLPPIGSGPDTDVAFDAVGERGSEDT